MLLVFPAFLLFLGNIKRKKWKTCSIRTALTHHSKCSVILVHRWWYSMCWEGPKSSVGKFSDLNLQFFGCFNRRLVSVTRCTLQGPVLKNKYPHCLCCEVIVLCPERRHVFPSPEYPTIDWVKMKVYVSDVLFFYLFRVVSSWSSLRCRFERPSYKTHAGQLTQVTMF